jgi:hypothetical protein
LIDYVQPEESPLLKALSKLKKQKRQGPKLRIAPPPQIPFDDDKALQAHFIYGYEREMICGLIRYPYLFPTFMDSFSLDSMKLSENVDFWSDTHLDKFIDCIYQEWQASSYLSGQAFFDTSTHLELNITLQSCFIEANALNIPLENRTGWFEELIQHAQEQAFVRSLSALQKELTQKHGSTVDPANDQVQQIIQRYQHILHHLKKLKIDTSLSPSTSSDDGSPSSFSKDVS